VSFTQSYGASGDQSRAVAAGQPADVVHFSLEPDIQRLVDAKLVPASWDQNQYHGIVANSVVVFAVRNGNPKNIHTWSDLVKPGVQVITPNPFTSGGARWNIMAAYGAQPYLSDGRPVVDRVTKRRWLRRARFAGSDGR
jgi:sulfate/thiosulfate transport system substrate-binding protein